MNNKLNNLDKTINQVILVEYISDINAKLSLCERFNDSWSIISQISAFVGKEGVTNEKREGDSKTPLGLYKLSRGFGIKDNPGTNLDYIKLIGNEYWIDDINSNQYNQLIAGNPNNLNAEHLIKEEPQYNYSIVIEYNTTNIIKGIGSAIFLHVSNKGGTAGCVAVEENYMIDILKWVDINKNPHIYII